jgi:tetratricopeptide (TPR) repeat protein
MMKKMKQLILLVLIAMTGFAAKSQSINEGKDFLYYERYTSAENVFKKILATNPNDEAATYHLGQALIGLERVPEAKALYLQKLSATPNSPMILAGVGHIELLEGKTADARQRFETAISLSKGKDIDVLNAVGFANSNYESKKGDAAYAVDVLTRATQIKKFNDPAVLTNLGDAYRKMGNGGEAVTAYDKALAINPNYARAAYRKGRVYQSQGAVQEELYLSLYNEAIAKDAKFAPVYSTLFNYFYEIDVPRSAQYLEKYLTSSDDDGNACMYRTSIEYAQGNFQNAIDKANSCLQVAGANAKLYQLKAFSYKRLKDTANANKNFQDYFAKQNPEKLQGGDYAAYASLLVNYPGNEMKVEEFTNRAVMMDTLAANKASYITTIAKSYEEAENFEGAAKWYARLLDVKKNFTNVDIFNAGYSYYAGNRFDSSNKYFTLYTEKYPEDIMGYYMLGNGSAQIDSTGSLGLAVPYYEKTIAIGLADTTKPQAINRVINAYKFFIGYYANAKKDFPKALEYIDRGLMLVPGDATLESYKAALSKQPAKKPAPKP